MKDLGIISGSSEQAKSLIIGKDTVYIHTDIEKVETDDGSEIYRYHEFQYEKDEYIRLMSERSAILEEQTTETQLALCELYELYEELIS